jgi:hypothetical protein
MINEKLGTPNVIKEIIDSNYNDIILIINNKNDSLLSINVNVKKLICNISLEINFSNTNLSFFDVYNTLRTGFKNCRIVINTTINNSEENIIKSITHELTHLYELYHTKNRLKSIIWKSSLEFFDYKKFEIPLDPIKYFYDLFYLALPNEIRARVSSIGIYLDLVKTKNNTEEFVNYYFYNSKEWGYYLMLKNFNYKEYIEELKNMKELKDCEIDGIILLFQKFNSLFHIKYEINNEKDIIEYFKKYEKFFHIVAERYKNKMLKILSSKILEKINFKILDYYSFEKYYDLDIFTHNIKEENKQEEREIIINNILEPYYKDYIKK